MPAAFISEHFHICHFISSSQGWAFWGKQNRYNCLHFTNGDTNSPVGLEEVWFSIIVTRFLMLRVKDKSPWCGKCPWPWPLPAVIFLPGYPAGLNQDAQVGLVQLQVSVSQKLRETSLALAQKPLVHLSALFLLSYLDDVPRRRGDG